MDRNRDLFWNLLEPEHKQAGAFCRKLAGNRESGDDLYQEALITAVGKFHSLRDIASFRPWLYRILINSFRNSVRRPWWKRFEPLTDELADRAPGDDPTAVYAARRLLERAFAAVSTEERALVTLFELEGWSIAELATLHGKSENAIKVRLFRSRKKMRGAVARHLSSSGRKPVKRLMMCEEAVCVVTKPAID